MLYEVITNIVRAMEPIAENRPQSVVIWQEELQNTLAGLPRTATTTDGGGDDKETLGTGSVISSYSIHYTKLYDARSSGSRRHQKFSGGVD